MEFGDREPGSVCKLIDQLHGGIKDISGIGEPLRVVRDEGEFWSMDNRRLAAFLMYQALRRHRLVKARCRIVPKDRRYWDRKKTLSAGLGIETREHYK